MTLAFIDEAGKYASSNEDNPEMNQIVRRLRVTASAFLAALNSVSRA
jgi:hypothetical protein